MLTIDELRRFGANVDEGKERCMNDETFYIEMVKMTLVDGNFDKLAAAISAGDKQTAFEAAHALKGIMANVSLTPMFTVTSEMTELLRAGEDADYQDYLDRILAMKDELAQLV